MSVVSICGNQHEARAYVFIIRNVDVMNRSFLSTLINYLKLSEVHERSRSGRYWACARTGTAVFLAMILFSCAAPIVRGGDVRCDIALFSESRSCLELGVGTLGATPDIH